MPPVLSVRNATKRFGGVTALDDVSFDVGQGELLGAIGPNGAGKSTLLSLISGAQRPTFGEIEFDSRRLDRMPAHAVARLGVGRAHQIPRPFRGMTVRQNVLVAAHSAGARVSNGHQQVDDVLRLCGLIDRAERLASSLSLLDLKRLEVARALALEPRLLLLDEVAAGLVGAEIDEITALVNGVRQRGVTILLVEHVQALIQSLADRVIVLDWGKKIAEGTPSEIARDPRVIEVYFGKSQVSGPKSQVEGSAGPRTWDLGPGTSAVIAMTGICVDYGKLRALRAIDFEVRQGEMVAVLGANGAGKTTLARAITGLVPLAEGSVLLDGADVSARPAYQRARLGISICHEGRHLFADLSVRENLELGAAYARAGASLTQRLERALGLFPEIRKFFNRSAGSLSGGQQQMVAIARALMSEPRLVIFDELSLGLAPRVVDRIYEALAGVREMGVSAILIEQNVYRSLGAADRVYVMERGRVSFSGSPQELRQHETLQAAYFGASAPAS